MQVAEDPVADAKTSTEAVDTQVDDGVCEKLTRISNFHN